MKTRAQRQRRNCPSTSYKNKLNEISGISKMMEIEPSPFDKQCYVNAELFVAKAINVSSVTITGTAYIFLEDKRELIQINEVGTFVWHQINGGRCIREIIQNCKQEYEGEDDEVAESVVAFLSTLQQEGLIEISNVQFEGIMSDVA